MANTPINQNPHTDGPDLGDVLDAISDIRSDMELQLQELKKIVKLLRDLPIDLERRE